MRTAKEVNGWVDFFFLLFFEKDEWMDLLMLMLVLRESPVVGGARESKEAKGCGRWRVCELSAITGTDGEIRSSAKSQICESEVPV